MTDVTVAQPSRQQIAAQTRSKPKRVTGKIAEAIDRMLQLGEPWDEAARNVDLTVRAMRLAISKPHVLAHLRERKLVLREHLSAANLFRLAQIRDAADNMPAVNAIKVLEQLGEESSTRSSTSAVAPGVTIIIHDREVTGSLSAPQRVVEAKPLITLDRDTLTESVRPSDE